MQDLERAINYSFRDASLLEMALTHPSASGDTNYQRLEFLGDAVLGMVISEFLYSHFPQESEGDLAKRKSQLVQGKTLVEVAEDLELPPYIELSEGEENTGGRTNTSNIEDVCEALIGALYLDGGFDVAREFILRHWKDKAMQMIEVPIEPRSKLQEYAQSLGMPLPLYETIAKEGADHAPIFTVRVSLENGEKATAQGESKKAAMKEAANALLDELKKMS